jgi:hypothetical protein
MRHVLAGSSATSVTALLPLAPLHLQLLRGCLLLLLLRGCLLLLLLLLVPAVLHDQGRHSLLAMWGCGVDCTSRLPHL